MYTLDTNAIIYYLKDEPAAAKFLKNVFSQDEPLYVSAMPEVELFSYPDLTDSESDRIKEFLRTVAVIPLDSQIARTAAEVRRTRQRGIADSVIAATALFTGTKLVTRNFSDFKGSMSRQYDDSQIR